MSPNSHKTVDERRRAVQDLLSDAALQTPDFDFTENARREDTTVLLEALGRMGGSGGAAALLSARRNALSLILHERLTEASVAASRHLAEQQEAMAAELGRLISTTEKLEASATRLAKIAIGLAVIQVMIAAIEFYR